MTTTGLRTSTLAIMRGAAVIATALTVLTAVPARAGDSGGVKGTITAGKAADPVVNAVVMLEGPAVPAASDAPHVVIDQRGDTFIPRVVAVAVGTTVEFANSDPHLHNVFAMSKAKQFDLGMYPQGEKKSVTFDMPGAVPVRCNVHPGMDAYVVVHTNPYAAVSDERGVYAITGVPEGSYTARVWHERLPERKIPIVVRSGQVQALDVHLDKAP
ncbi:MAG TPA: carboxypeptidase regulatory-like domain-containing protein [Candidatus Binatia bacterium]|jgi:plastocyanin